LRVGRWRGGGLFGGRRRRLLMRCLVSLVVVFHGLMGDEWVAVID
jgi:hypothetical protein